ncbi:hypothetical protein C8Q76DRAFT_609282 [Earliella scabrosa]|nr:hypothetical protein C8Q76DRAFT_608438 [Earliella scabrosa]KAI0740946.1 hypothetical protein C8Q76DRAFT_609282 [Earliella scabrosa]
MGSTADSNSPRDEVATEQADWLCRLVGDTYSIVRSKKGGTLYAQSYFPASSTTPSFAPRAPSFKISSISGTIVHLEERVCWEVIRALRQWLDFPHQTDLLGAQFVMRLIRASGTLDVLLLDGVWNTFRAIKTRILGEARTVHSGSKNRASASDSLEPVAGHKTLLSLVRELIPLVQHGIPTASTSIQRRVWERMDFLLPFREHAPTRQRLASLPGPGHPKNIKSKGALASCILSRVLHFDTPFIRNDSVGFFEDASRWRQAIVPFTSSNLPATHFVNPTCYGPYQPGREVLLTTPKAIERFFEAEDDWTTFCKGYGRRKIPFVDCLEWFSKIGLPQFGTLTQYLVAADLSYSGRITKPTATEIAQRVAKHRKGSFRGLVTAKLIVEPASNEQVVDAFICAHRFLSDKLTAAEKKIITFDPVMTEHLLCKYNRLFSKKD